MTLDEAIQHAEEVMVANLEKTKDRNASDPIAINCFECADDHRQLAEWLKELKEYREQEPCDDAISRHAVINLVRGCNSALEEPSIFDCHNAGVKFEQYITELPSVRPQEPQTGHWIRQDNTKEPLYGWYFCSECNSVIGDKTKFCSNCGARMERGDKE